MTDKEAKVDMLIDDDDDFEEFEEDGTLFIQIGKTEIKIKNKI